jgi:hypothetical protein
MLRFSEASVQLNRKKQTDCLVEISLLKEIIGMKRFIFYHLDLLWDYFTDVWAKFPSILLVHLKTTPKG